MKKILTLFLFLATGSAIAQDAPATEAETNCYQKYAVIFEKRGAADVEDGTYDDVIITVRRGSGADCFNGKVEVEKGHIKSMYIKFSDNTYEKIEKKWKTDISKIVIVNGISETMMTKDEELINVMFIKKIKPKKKEYQRAPDPVVDTY